jgi:hypothetical protein
LYLIKDVFELVDGALDFFDVLGGVGKCDWLGFFLIGEGDDFMWMLLWLEFGLAFLGADESFAFEVVVWETAFGGLREGRGVVELGVEGHKNSS